MLRWASALQEAHGRISALEAAAKVAEAESRAALQAKVKAGPIPTSVDCLSFVLLPLTLSLPVCLSL